MEVPVATPHSAFARYYLRRLRGPADRDAPREDQLLRLALAQTELADADVRVLCDAILHSFRTFGPHHCSASVLEEIDVSRNPSLSADGLHYLLDTLYALAAFGVASDGSLVLEDGIVVGLDSSKTYVNPHHQEARGILSTTDGQADDGVATPPDEVESEETNKGRPSQPSPTSPTSTSSCAPRDVVVDYVLMPGSAINALTSIRCEEASFLTCTRLATMAVRLARASRSLTHLVLPPKDEEEHIASAEALDEAQRHDRQRMILERLALDDDDIPPPPTPHAFDNRTHFCFEDIPIQLELNTIPLAAKRAALNALGGTLLAPGAAYHVTEGRFAMDTLTALSEPYHGSVMDLSEPLVHDDTHRAHPKTYGPVSGRLVAHALAASKTIRTVDLSGNNPGDEATALFAECLRRNAHLVDVRLRSNQISSKGGMALVECIADGNQTLVELDISDNNCSDVVAHAFEKLIIAGSSGLGFINWDHNCVSRTLVSELNYSFMLNAQPRNVKDSITRLRKQDMLLTRVNWSAEQPIVSDNTVKVLMQTLRGNTIVTHVDVSNSQITNIGAAYLAEIIANCSSLKKLIAQFNYITDEGALVLLHSLPRSKTLEKLDLKFQQPEPISSKILLAIEQISDLGNQPFEVRTNGLALVVDDPTCSALDLSTFDGEHRVTDATVQTLFNLLRSNTSLQSLNLSQNRGRVTGPRSLPVIIGFAQHLKKLYLNYLALEDEPVVEYLGKQFLAREANAPALEELYLEDNLLTSITSYELALIVREKNHTVKRISMIKNIAITTLDHDVTDFYCGLNRYPRVFKDTCLAVESNEKKNLTNICFSTVEKYHTKGTSHHFVKELDDYAMRLLCVALAQNSVVSRVTVNGNLCTDVGATYWAQLLRVNVSLIHLDLSYNQIGEEGLLEICESIEETKTLKVFVYDSNPGAKNEALNVRIREAIRRSNGIVGVGYVTAHAVDTVHGPKALPVSAAQVQSIDTLLEDAITADAMAGYRAARVAAEKVRQQHAAITQ